MVGLDVYVNVVKIVKMKIVIVMEFVKVDVMVYIMGNVVIFFVFWRIVKDVIKCLVIVYNVLKDCMGWIVVSNVVGCVWKGFVIWLVYVCKVVRMDLLENFVLNVSIR